MADTPTVTVTADAIEQRVARARRLAELLDESVRIPVVNYRVGVDALVGLLPVVGDSFGLVCSLLIVAEGIRLGVSRRTLLVMLSNVCIDLLGGSIPLLGDVFDATWKANMRNVRLLERDLLD